MNIRKLPTHVFALLFLLVTSPALAAPTPMLHASNATIVDAKGAPVQLACVNLSPWLNPEPYLMGKSFKGLTTSPSQLKEKLEDVVGPEKAAAFWHHWEENFVTEADFARLHDHGFICVRLPLNYKMISITGPNAAIRLNEAGLVSVDNAVKWGARHGIYVMLDLHAAPGGQNAVPTVSDVSSKDKTARLWSGDTAADNRKMTVTLWRLLAGRYKDAASVGGYDLLNEPALPSGFSADTLPKFYDDITAAIRTVDPAHMIILEGNGYARDFSVFPPPRDANILYQFHEYSLFNADWKNPGQKQLEPFLALRAKYHRPLWLGEFGEEKPEWQSRMVQLMKENQIGWAVWPWKRIDLGNGHPVVETIALPESWEKLYKYLVGAFFAGKPSPAEAERGMNDMLDAIRTENCREDSSLAKALTGK